MIREFAADHDLRFGPIMTVFKHLEAQTPVVQQQVRARLERIENFRVRQTGHLGTANLLLGFEAVFLAAFKLDAAAFEIADAEFRPLQIEQDRDGPAVFLFQTANDTIALAMALMLAVRKIHPKNVHPCFEQGRNLLFGATGGPQCRDDLCVSVTSHQSHFMSVPRTLASGDQRLQGKFTVLPLLK